MIELEFKGIKNRELVAFFYTNAGKKSMYTFSDNIWKNKEPKEPASFDIVVDDSIHLQLDLKSDLAAFHVIIQEYDLDQELIYSRPHVIGCAIIFYNQLVQGTEIKLGLNSNYLADLPFNNCGISLVVNTSTVSPHSINNVDVKEFERINKQVYDFLHDHYPKMLPITPVWYVEGIDCGSVKSTLRFGVPINYYFQVQPDQAFCTENFLIHRFQEICQVNLFDCTTVHAMLKLYPNNSTAEENQRCEGLMMKLAMSQVNTRPYMKDFQRCAKTGNIIETDYYFLFKYMVGDCSFDANIIYRIWMDILFSAKTSSTVAALRHCLCRIGVPVVFKGRAGAKKFGHIFAALVHLDTFSALVKDTVPDFELQWKGYFNIVDDPPIHVRNEKVLIAEGTAPASVHYSPRKHLDHSHTFINLQHGTWSMYTRPISLDSRSRFHQEILLMFTWVIPIITQVNGGTMFSFKTTNCEQIQYHIGDINCVCVDTTFPSGVDELLNKYYLPAYKLTYSQEIIDHHRYHPKKFTSHLSQLIYPKKRPVFPTKLTIQEIIYVYDLDEEAKNTINKHLEKRSYLIFPVGFSKVIIIYT